MKFQPDNSKFLYNRPNIAINKRNKTIQPSITGIKAIHLFLYFSGYFLNSPKATNPKINDTGAGIIKNEKQSKIKLANASGLLIRLIGNFFTAISEFPF